MVLAARALAAARRVQAVVLARRVAAAAMLRASRAMAAAKLTAIAPVAKQTEIAFRHDRVARRADHADVAWPAPAVMLRVAVRRTAAASAQARADPDVKARARVARRPMVAHGPRRAIARAGAKRSSRTSNQSATFRFSDAISL